MIFPRGIFESLVILLVTCGSSKSGSPWVFNEEGCITPDGEAGDCIPTVECRYMKEALSIVRRPLSPAAKKQLEEYICDINDGFRVCCPSRPIIIKEGVIAVKIGIPDITSHRNYHLLPTNCGFLDIAVKKVINGMNAGLTEYPWMTLINYRDSDVSDSQENFKCAGTIINDKYILTAGHCLEEKSELLSVRVGEYDLDSPRDCYKGICNDPVQDLAIEEVIIHPNFNSTGLANDIGLLRVTPIKFNDKNIGPICLPRGNSKMLSDDYVELTGWGLTQAFSDRSFSNVLQLAYLRVANLTECKEIYKKFPDVSVDETKICAGGGKNNSYACSGDSGGPVQVQEKFNNVIRYIQHGVVSLGPLTCNSATIFTKVSHYMEWILDNIKP